MSLTLSLTITLTLTLTLTLTPNQARGGLCVSGACLAQGGDAPLWVNGASMLLADGVSISALEIDTRLCPTQRGGCAVEFAVAATGRCHAGDPATPYALPAGTRCAGDGVTGRCVIGSAHRVRP